MAITRRFIQLQSALVTNDAPAKALEAAIIAVCQVYSNQDAEMALALCNDTPQYMRKQFASWLRGYGVLITEPVRGTADYTIGEGLVKDKGKQKSIIEKVKSSEVAVVLLEEPSIRRVVKPKELKGTAKERAAKKMESVVKALKKEDAETAAYINDRWATSQADTNEAFFDLSRDEEEYLIQCLMERRMASMLRKAA